jgi:hypothetical protein
MVTAAVAVAPIRRMNLRNIGLFTQSSTSTVTKLIRQQQQPPQPSKIFYSSQKERPPSPSGAQPFIVPIELVSDTM